MSVVRARRTARDARGPSTRSDEPALVAACLAGPSRGVRRHRRAPSPRGLPGVLPLRRQSRGCQRSRAGSIRAGLARTQEFQGQAALSTWLYRIAVNACLNRVQRRRRSKSNRSSRDQFVDTQTEDPRAGLLRGERAARGAASDCAAARQAARDADPAHLSRAVTPADRRHAGELGRRRQGQLLPRAGQLEEDPGATSHDAPDPRRARRRHRRHARLDAATRISMRARTAASEVDAARGDAARVARVDGAGAVAALLGHFSQRVRAAIAAEPPRGRWPPGALAGARAAGRAGAC